LSVRVLVVPEDPAHNGYILKPLVSRMLTECGKPGAVVTVLTNPRAKGYSHAKALLREQLLDRYRHMDLLLFLPDADGKDRTDEFRDLEAEGKRRDVRLLCCAARQEVEVWLLGGHRDKLEQRWQDVRADVSVKENVFTPFLAAHGNPKAAGGGRDLLMQEALGSYRSLLAVCEELADLEERIRRILG
jgi:hypothetical protein